MMPTFSCLSCLQHIRTGTQYSHRQAAPYCSQAHSCTLQVLARPVYRVTSYRHLKSQSIPVQAMSSEDGYSLWLEPEGAMRDCLATEISLLAEQHKHLNAPVFPPHVTLLGSLQQPEDKVLATAQELASQLKVYRIRFQDVTRGTFYYQCVFLRAHDDPDTMHAAALARQLYDKHTPPYMPHLSLLYADLTDEQKDEVAAASRKRLYTAGQAFDQLGGAEFTVHKISVWYTPTDDRSCASWKRVAEFSLQD